MKDWESLVDYITEHTQALHGNAISAVEDLEIALAVFRKNIASKAELLRRRLGKAPKASDITELVAAYNQINSSIAGKERQIIDDYCRVYLAHLIEQGQSLEYILANNQLVIETHRDGNTTRYAIYFQRADR